MAVTKNCLAENNVSTCFKVKLQGLNFQTDEANSHQAHFKEAVQKRTINGIPTYRCRDVLFSPKKQGLQDADFNRNLGLSILWQGIPRLAASCSSFHFQLPTIHQPGKRCLGASVGSGLN